MGTLSTSTSSIITWPENLSKKLMEDLAQGKESATQLQMLLHNPKPFDWSISAVDLADKILTSFTDSISVVMSVSNSKNNHNKDPIDVQCSSDNHDRLSSGTVINGGQSNEVVSRVNAQQEPLDHDLSHCDDRSSEDSGQISSKKKRPAFKDRRGCYKRRKSSHSWSTVGSTIEDGQAWRKYGQKEILNAEYPRAYFRCTRKHDQGCKAIKQVQQIQDNPKVYNTIYIGQHTCKNTLKAPQMIVDSQTYNNTQLSNDDHHHHNIVNPNHPHHESRKDHINWASKPDNHGSIFSTPLKKEDEDRDQNVHSEEDQSEGKSSFETDYLWSDFKDIEISDPTMGLLSSNIVNKPKFMGSEDGHGIDDDVADSIAFSFDDDEFVVKSMEFHDCDFHFDDTEFPIGLA